MNAWPQLSTVCQNTVHFFNPITYSNISYTSTPDFLFCSSRCCSRHALNSLLAGSGGDTHKQGLLHTAAHAVISPKPAALGTFFTDHTTHQQNHQTLLQMPAAPRNICPWPWQLRLDCLSSLRCHFLKCMCIVYCKCDWVFGGRVEIHVSLACPTLAHSLSVRAPVYVYFYQSASVRQGSVTCAAAQHHKFCLLSTWMTLHASLISKWGNKVPYARLKWTLIATRHPLSFLKPQQKKKSETSPSLFPFIKNLF